MTTKHCAQQFDEARRKRVLLLMSTVDDQAEAFRKAAVKIGVALAAGSDHSGALEDPWSAGAIAAPFDDPYGAGQRIVEYAERHPLDAVIAVGDRSAIAAAVACETLGIPFHQPFASFACQDRFEFRSLLEGTGLPVPRFERMAANAMPPSLPPKLGFPCVLKPAARSGSQSVIRADNAEEFTAAFTRVQKLLQSPEARKRMDDAENWILVEEYLEGQEAAVEAIIDHGRFLLLAVFDHLGDQLGDQLDPREGPGCGETIYITPSRLPEEMQAEIARAAALAARAAGLYHGPVHAQVRLTRAGPRVLDMTARPVDGLRARALGFENGWSLEELILRHALGEDIESVGREAAAAGVMTIPAPTDGVLEEVQGEAEARSVPGIEDIRIPARQEEEVVTWPDGASRLGFLLARGKSPDEVETALQEARRRLVFRVTRG